MSTHSLVDDILRSLSHLPDPAQPPQTQPSARTLAQGYTTDHNSPTKTNNPLLNLASAASENAKSLFLTLHFLFPHELLPALDLLDRGLVTRLIPSATSSTDTTKLANTPEHDVFYVQSASAATSQHQPKHNLTTSGEPQGRFHNALANSSKGKGSATRTYYEVRLDSWNCTCAAFAFSSFTCLTKEDEDNQPPIEDTHGAAGAFQDEEEEIADDASKDSTDWRFGGILTLPNGIAGVPVCKHILAAVMVRAAPGLFVEGEHYSIRRNVGREEMAGWGAGWGD